MSDGVLSAEMLEEAYERMKAHDTQYVAPVVYMSYEQMEKLYASLIPNTLEGWLAQEKISQKVQAKNPLAKQAAQIKKSKLWKVLA